MFIPFGKRSFPIPTTAVVLISLALVLGIAGSLTDIQPTPAGAAVNSTWLSYANGDDVRALVQDGNTIWAGTQGGGLIRWNPDARMFTQYLRPNDGLIGNDVRDVAIDSNGNLWIATNRGVSRLSRDGAWTSYTQESTRGWLLSNNITAIAVARNDTEGDTIWFGMSQAWDGNNWVGGGVSRLNPDETWDAWDANNGIASNNVTDIAIEQHDGNTWVWVTTRPHLYWDSNLNQWQPALGGISVFDGRFWTSVARDPTASNPWPKSNYLSGVAIDSHHNKWFATCQAGVNALEGTDPYDTSRWTSFDSSSQVLPSDFVVAVAADPNPARSVVWMATAHQCGPVTSGHGVSRLDYKTSIQDKSDDEWTTFTSSHGLPSETVRAIMVPTNQEISDQVWLGTGDPTQENYGDGAGIVRLDVPSRSVNNVLSTADPTLNQHTLPSNYITAIAQGPDGRIWVGTRKRGAAVWDGHTWTWYTKANTNGGLPSNNIHGIAFEGLYRIWFATEAVEYDPVNLRWKDGGVAMLEGNRWETWTVDNSYQRGDQVAKVTSLTLVTMDTVSTDFASREQALQALDPGYVMFEGDDTLYILVNVFSQAGTGVKLRVAPPLKKELPFDSAIQKVKLGLSENRTTAIAVADGKLWVGAGDVSKHEGFGLDVFDLTSRSWLEPLRYPMIASDLVTKIVPATGQNQVWLSATYARSHQNTSDLVGGGVSVRQGETWTNYSNVNTGFVAYLNDVRSIAAANGLAWAGAFNWTGQGLLPSDYIGVDAVVNQFNGGWSSESFVREGYIADLAVDHLNRVWAVTSRNGNTPSTKTIGPYAPPTGLRVRDGSVWYTYNTANSDLVSNDLQVIAITNDNQKWIGSFRSGISVLQVDGVPATATPLPTATEGNTPAPTPQGTQSVPTPATATPRTNTGIEVLTSTPTPFGTPPATPTPVPIPPSEVPEAGTIILLGSGLASLAAYARLRRRARSPLK